MSAACEVCGGEKTYTPAVNVILFEVPGRPKPYRLWSDEDYVVCAHEGCTSVLHFLERAIESHAEAREVVGQRWTRVRIVFDDLDGWLIAKPHRQEVAQA